MSDLKEILQQLQQSRAEIYRVLQDWENLYAPKNLIKSKETATLLVDWAYKNYGLVSFTSLNHAVQALAAQVLTPEPKPLSFDELAAIENAKSHADYMRSIAPQENFGEKVARDRQKRLADEAAKAQKDAKSQTALAIASYECYLQSGAGLDYSATEMVRQELQGVRVGNDHVRTLAAVKQVISELPDHPKAGDVARAVEKINREQQQVKETSQNVRRNSREWQG